MTAQALDLGSISSDVTDSHKQAVKETGRGRSFMKGFGSRDPVNLNMKTLMKAGGAGAMVGAAYTSMSGDHNFSDVVGGAGIGAAGMAGFKYGKSLQTGIWNGYKKVKEHDESVLSSTFNAI